MLKHELLIAKAKSDLITRQPFFAALLCPMPLLPCEEIETFATDGETILFNPAWVETLNQNEVTFVLAHEVLHCVLDHMGRRENRDPMQWNIAADYIINDLLVKEKIGAMPKVGLLDAGIVAAGNGTAEGVYSYLQKKQAGKKDPKKGSGKSSGAPKPGDKGGPLDQVLDSGAATIEQDPKTGKITVKQGPTDPAKKARQAQERLIRITQAANAAKMRGELSAGLERLVAEAVKPVVDWRRVLREFVSDRAKTEYSFARPKRRFLAQDLYLAGLNGEALGPLVIAVDCSGSVSDEDLAKFSAEINSIREETKPAKIKIIYFDSEILEPAKGAATEFGPEDEIELTPVGGGGTAFSPIFRAIGECEDPAPCACIVLTDLVCSDYGPAPAYPVLWTISNGRGGPYAPPFGATVEILDK